MEDRKEIMIINQQSLRDRIYTIRGQQVMLDFDLAEIYGYTVSAFNQQVKNNLEKFEGDDFCFYLEPEEFDRLKNLMSNNLTSSWGGRRKPPRVFTESGIYMLMTVLRGELAIKQSRALIRTFRAMKNYIIENQQLMITQRDYIALAEKVSGHAADIEKIKENMVTRTDLSDFMKLFDSDIEQGEILILNGEPFKADLAYQKIYRLAKRKLMVIDDYISTKTLQHLLHSRSSVSLVVVSDNKARPPLRSAEYADFQKENPGRSIGFFSSAGKVHDRYIILDCGTSDMKVYHCGASSKDAGKKITTITQVKDISAYKDMVKDLLENLPLLLK